MNPPPPTSPIAISPRADLRISTPTLAELIHQSLLHIPTDDAWMDGVIDILVNGIAAKPAR